MKFLTDVCADSLPLREALRNHGHDVLSAQEYNPCASDEFLLTLAHREGRILVTEDKDFRELVFLRRLPHPCIVRLCEMTPMERVDAMLDLIENNGVAMLQESVIVVTGNRVRIRSATNLDGNKGLDSVRSGGKT